MDEAERIEAAVANMQTDAARAGYAALDQAAKAVDHTAHAGESAVKQGQDVTERLAEATMGVAETERRGLMLGIHSAAQMGSRAADASVDKGRNLLGSTVQVMDIYRDAAERSASRVQALFGAWMTVGRGVQQMQHAWLNTLESVMDGESRKPQDLLRCRTMVELAEVQRDLYLGAVHRAFASSSRMLEIAGRTAQDAVQPLASVN